MGLKIYVAYGAGPDQKTALRLQALAAVNGLTVYVPPVHTRQDPSGQLDLLSEQRLQGCDMVLGVLTVVLSEACRNELNLAKELSKRIIILAEPGLALSLEPHFPGSIAVIDPADPARAEHGIVEFLRQSGLQQDAAKALLALGTIALGLLIFAPQD